MKTKIFKKIIAVFCAATMSTSVIAPAGAITTTSQLSAKTSKNLENLNAKIQNCLQTLQKMDQTVTNKWPQNTEDELNIEAITLSNISSINEKLTALNKLSVPDLTMLGKIDECIENIGVKLIQLSYDIQNLNDCDNTKTQLSNINRELENLLTEANNSINQSRNNNMGMMNMNNMNNMMNEIWWKSLSPNQKKNYLNNLLSNNAIFVPITLQDWNHNNVEKFISNATYDDVIKLPSLIKELVYKPLSNMVPEYLYYNNGIVFFYNGGLPFTNLVSLIGTLHDYAKGNSSNPQKLSFQSDNNIRNKQQYAHLIETLKK